MGRSKEVTTSSALFDLLEASRLLPPESIDDARRICCDVSEPKRVARRLVKREMITQWQARQLLAGRYHLRLGKYRLIDSFGSGSYGRVYLAEHVQMQRRVVLKVLGRRNDASSNSLGMFLAEARAIASLDHRNIVHVYDFDCEDDRHYIVMEYVDGRDLRLVVREDHPLPVNLVATYICQAADGLAYAHDLDIVHGELTPANLLVDSHGTLKIGNMGVARLAAAAGHKALSTDKRKETLRFLAPEQLEEAGRADCPSDVYSLGCTFFFLLTGRPPVSPEQATRDKVSRNVLAYRAETPVGLAKILDMMMAENPDDRYDSAGSVKHALETWVQEFANQNQPSIDGKSHQAVSSPPLPKQNLVQPKSAADPALSIRGQHRQSKPRTSVAARSHREKQAIVLLSIGAAGVALAALALSAVLFWPETSETADSSRGQAADQWEEPEDVHEQNKDSGRTSTANDRKEQTKNEGKTTPSAPKPAIPSANPTVEDSDVAVTDSSGEEQPLSSASTEVASVSEVDMEDPIDFEPGVGEPVFTTDDSVLQEEVDPVDSEEPGMVADPFKDVPSTVDLPQLPTKSDNVDIEQPGISLGTMTIPSDEMVALSLGGGDQRGNGGAAFSIENSDKNPENREWNVQVSKARETTDEPTTIAHLSIIDGQLMFQWTQQALANKVANYLRNCPLTIRVRDFSRTIVLREPETAEPIMIQFGKRPIRTILKKMAWAPDPKSLQVEFTQLDGEFVGATFEPEAAVLASGGETTLLLGQPDPLLRFSMKVSMRNARSTMRINVTPFFQVDPGQEPKQLNLKNERVAWNTVLVSLRQHQDFLDRLTEQINGAATADKALFENQKKQVQDGIFALETAHTRLNQLEATKTSLNEKGVVHFRVYYSAGDEQVELLNTGGTSAPENSLDIESGDGSGEENFDQMPEEFPEET